MNRSAIISPDGVYRYSLSRSGWMGDGTLIWLLLNPSTADASVDDPTIRRVIGFTQREGYAEAVILNLFALRSTNPDVLVDHPDPVGEINDRYLVTQTCSRRVVCAWGAHPVAAERGRTVMHDALRFSTPLCLGVTAGGQPRHPLYLPKTAALIPYHPIDIL
jgi:hypothetical protein